MRTFARPALRALMTAVLVTAAGTALARPDTRAMTCVQTQRLIVRSGAAVLTTGRHTYDRYVAGARFCSWPDVPTRAFVPTSDVADCPVFNCRRFVPPFLDD